MFHCEETEPPVFIHPAPTCVQYRSKASRSCMTSVHVHPFAGLACGRSLRTAPRRAWRMRLELRTCFSTSVFARPLARCPPISPQERCSLSILRLPSPPHARDSVPSASFAVGFR